MDILKDKNVLITGSSSGIGKAIALLFASEGANVILCSNKSVSDGESVLSEVISMGSRATYYSADLQSEDEIKDLFKKIEDKYASIDILNEKVAKDLLIKEGKSRDIVYKLQER